jgi:hypothetical protein
MHRDDSHHKGLSTHILSEGWLLSETQNQKEIFGSVRVFRFPGRVCSWITSFDPNEDPPLKEHETKAKAHETQIQRSAHQPAETR